MSTVLSTIPRLYTAIAQWASCMVYLLVYHRQRRFKTRDFALISVIALVVMSCELVLTDDLPILFWIPAMAGSAFLMYLFLLICNDMTYRGAGYCCVRAFVLSELAASLEWQLYYYGISNGMSDGEGIQFAFMLLVYSGVFLVGYLLERGITKDSRGEDVPPREFLTALCIGLLVFGISNLSFLAITTPFSGSVESEIYNIRTFVDLGGMAVLFAYHMQHMEMRARYELASIENLLEAQYLQYKQSRESIEMINRKYHDLKNQIAALRAESDEERRAAWLDAMESDIISYEAQNKTGNSVLDTVLTSKSLYCQKHSIVITSVVDGTLVNFIDAMDLCTIFGNALDNAIEAVLKLPDKEKRLIHLSCAAQKGFVLIKVENYFEGELKKESGRILSLKGDDRFHGFGIKSIRYSAERYGGFISISTDKNWFDLRVLIPIPEQQLA